MHVPREFPNTHDLLCVLDRLDHVVSPTVVDSEHVFARIHRHTACTSAYPIAYLGFYFDLTETNN
ncbi:hypothetical protein DPMN_091211 [Dreissena polymorpha]|uniref:Uncharacterized protein n=1 Tax=Dreissena polymorpha TaxID=45954 RepID=A0A9D4KZ56_DREPO|nr:hypothetical protein DPMN_091202 [Dreissena polymorpha]KAH3848828.1 hypothetical protein DPMN_091211 [Dreissena polymorpha]